jgi:diaminopimelate epimerase
LGILGLIIDFSRYILLVVIDLYEGAMMQFTKMQGIGNDYVYIDGFNQTVVEPEKLAVVVSDRHFGIGSDGLILVLPSQAGDFRMRMFNADGSESEMCGNGVRCAAKFACEHGLVQPHSLDKPFIRDLLNAAMPDADNLGLVRVETLRGVLELGLAGKNGVIRQVCVDMGRPILNPSEIPVKVTGRQAVGVPFTIGDQHLLLTAVSMGNPHAVFFCPDVAAIDLERIGPTIERHAMFPRRINVHFVQKISDSQVKMRTWERGSGITLACGTGASAVCVAGVLASKTQRRILAQLPGGNLELCWNEADDHVYLTGPAVEVFTGNWPG